MCQVLGVSTSGYYAWCRRSESAHAQRDRQLRVLVRASFDASKQRYGSPRIHEDLHRAARAGQSQAGDSADAGGRPESAGAETLQVHDDERSRPAGRGESARPAVHGRRAESALGRRHDRVRDRRERQVVSGGDPRPVFAVRRRLGRQRRQRPASDAEGARHGAEATVSRRPACCTTPTRAARTRARTTSGCSTRTGSRAR